MTADLGLMVPTGAVRQPSFVDYDGDGDLDVFIAFRDEEQRTAARNLLTGQLPDVIWTVQGDATDLSFADESFDLVTTFILFHEAPPRIIKAVLEEAFRMLKSGGDINLLSNSQLVVQEYGASSLLSLTAGNLLNFGTGAVVRVKGAEATGTQPNVDLTKTETAPAAKPETK